MNFILWKDKDFIIKEEGKQALLQLKQSLVEAPNWDLPYEIKCSTLDYVVGTFLGQRIDKKPYVVLVVLGQRIDKKQRSGFVILSTTIIDIVKLPDP